MAGIAKRVIKENKLSETITVIDKRSSEMTAGSGEVDVQYLYLCYSVCRLMPVCLSIRLSIHRVCQSLTLSFCLSLHCLVTMPALAWFTAFDGTVSCFRW